VVEFCINFNLLKLSIHSFCSNVAEVVYMQHLMCVEGVIVDRVEEITESVSDFSQAKLGEEKGLFGEGEKMQVKVKGKPQFSKDELSFLLKLIPELLQP
ncbi:hypothetical protein COLO4_13218, partial [Corchorus olitorius]